MGLISWAKRGYQEIFKSPNLWVAASIIEGPVMVRAPRRCTSCHAITWRSLWRVRRWGNWPMRPIYICSVCAKTTKEAREIFDRWENAGL